MIAMQATADTPPPVPRRTRWRNLGPMAALLAVLLNFAVTLGVTAIMVWPVGGIDKWGMFVWGASGFLTLGTLTLGAAIARKPDRLAGLIAKVYLAGIPVTILLLLTHFIHSQPLNLGLTFIAALLLLIALIWILPVGLAGSKGWSRLAGLPALLLLLAGNGVIYGTVESMQMLYTVEADDEEDYGPDIDVESLYGAQDGLMADQIAALAPQIAGKTELFAVLGAGNAYQSVFLSEVQAVGTQLETEYAAKGHILRLANSDQSPELYPMASRRNIATALKSIGTRMGAEDVALLFLTSHGAREVFSLNFYEAGLADLTADELAEMLGSSGIGNAVVVLSACHAGSFIDKIKAPNRLIIAAAAADRASFGCADGNNWTEFGRAYFDQALRKTPDFRTAFTTAQTLVAKREAELHQKPSLPQLSQGQTIGPALDALLAQISEK